MIEIDTRRKYLREISDFCKFLQLLDFILFDLKFGILNIYNNKWRLFLNLFGHSDVYEATKLFADTLQENVHDHLNNFVLI